MVCDTFCVPQTDGGRSVWRSLPSVVSWADKILVGGEEGEGEVGEVGGGAEGGGWQGLRGERDALKEEKRRREVDVAKLERWRFHTLQTKLNFT